MDSFIEQTTLAAGTSTLPGLEEAFRLGGPGKL
jgi:hypothetical protein